MLWNMGVHLNVRQTSHVKHLISWYIITYETNNLKKGLYAKAYYIDDFLSILNEKLFNSVNKRWIVAFWVRKHFKIKLYTFRGKFTPNLSKPP